MGFNKTLKQNKNNKPNKNNKSNKNNKPNKNNTKIKTRKQCHPRVDILQKGCFPTEIYKRALNKLGKNTNDITDTNSLDILEKELGVSNTNSYSFLNAMPLIDKEKEYLAKQYLRPKQPIKWKDDPDMWLDSTDITSVMKQYEEAYPSFEFMGPFPIDFAAPDPYNTSITDKSDLSKKCLIAEMCALQIKKAKEKGILYIGIIYNLDPHFKDGSHWVANFIDLKKNSCYYFDSYGYEPPSQINKFMKWLTTQDPTMKLKYNARRFQYKGSECGMYSLHFIIRMLMGDDFRKFCRKAPRDNVMLELRNWYFST